MMQAEETGVCKQNIYFRRKMLEHFILFPGSGLVSSQVDTQQIFQNENFLMSISNRVIIQTFFIHLIEKYDAVVLIK
jgi:hypothetical protein